MPGGKCKINPVEMAYLIQVTYHLLAGSPDPTNRPKERQNHDEEIDVKLICCDPLVAL